MHIRDMNAVTIVSDSAEDRQACEKDCQLVDAALAEAKELRAWKRFGTLSFEDYVGWVLQNLVSRS